MFSALFSPHHATVSLNAPDTKGQLRDGTVDPGPHSKGACRSPGFRPPGLSTCVEPEKGLQLLPSGEGAWWQDWSWHPGGHLSVPTGPSVAQPLLWLHSWARQTRARQMASRVMGTLPCQETSVPRGAVTRSPLQGPSLLSSFTPF